MTKLITLAIRVSWLSLVIGVLPARPIKGADEPFVLPVWPGAVPGDYGKIGSEHVRAPSEAPTKDAKWITGVTKPTLTIFRPTTEKNTGTAIVICPGGGYWNLAWDLEGEEVAAWLNTVGVTAAVLMYLALKRAKVPAELHLYAQGGHGFGARKSPLPCSTWTDRCVAWLKNQRLLSTSSGTPSNTPFKSHQ